MKVNKIKVLHCEILLNVVEFGPGMLSTFKCHLVLEKTEIFC
jgi:hypothetical protein